MKKNKKKNILLGPVITIIILIGIIAVCVTIMIISKRKNRFDI